jgi:hypothetical protein
MHRLVEAVLGGTLERNLRNITGLAWDWLLLLMVAAFDRMAGETLREVGEGEGKKEGGGEKRKGGDKTAEETDLKKRKHNKCNYYNTK